MISNVTFWGIIAVFSAIHIWLWFYERRIEKARREQEELRSHLLVFAFHELIKERKRATRMFDRLISLGVDDEEA